MAASVNDTPNPVVTGFYMQDYLWAAEFGLACFASKFAARSDAYGTAACLSRAVNQILLVLFALNRRCLINDKTALEEASELECAPAQFAERVQEVFSSPGASAEELRSTADKVVLLLAETIQLTHGFYQARFPLPG